MKEIGKYPWEHNVLSSSEDEDNDTDEESDEEGEESEDIWKKYYLNGKCQVARPQVIIPEFDESKLV